MLLMMTTSSLLCEFNRAIEFMEGYSQKKPEKKVKGVRGNIIEGGPVKPDTTNMTEEESMEALREYAKGIHG